jgi:hypothetical protein
MAEYSGRSLWYRPCHQIRCLHFPAQIAGEVKNFDITDYISAKDARRMDTFIHFGMAAGIQAVRDAGLDKENAADPERVGVAIGSGIGGLPLIEETKEEYHRWWYPQGVAVLCARFDHQHDLRQPVDHVSVSRGRISPTYRHARLVRTRLARHLALLSTVMLT